MNNLETLICGSCLRNFDGARDAYCCRDVKLSFNSTVFSRVPKFQKIATVSQEETQHGSHKGSLKLTLTAVALGLDGLRYVLWA
jgi:hypothetical protein